MKPIPLIYFVTALEKARFPVKIGRSNSASIHGRLSALQTSHPYELTFLFVMEGGAAEEAAAHAAFADLRLKGEWFKRANELMDVIGYLQEQNPSWRDLLAFPHLEFPAAFAGGASAAAPDASTEMTEAL